MATSKSTSPATDARLKRLGERVRVLKAEELQLERAMTKNSRALDEAMLKLAQASCPLKKRQKVALDATTVMTIEDIRIDEVRSNGMPVWTAWGSVLRYDPAEVRPQQVRGYTYLKDKDWRKLSTKLPAPAQIARDWVSKREAWLQAALTKPLALTTGQVGLLKHLIDREGGFPLLGMLPRGVTWGGSKANDQRIWQGLVDKGVLARADDKGDVSFHDWLVSPGPRLEEACTKCGIKLNPRLIAQARKRKISTTPMP